MSDLIERLRRNAESGDSCKGVSEDMDEAAAEIERLQAYADGLAGERFSDRVHVALQSRAETAEARYHELVLAVANKYHGETRHETALRYIREREMPKDDGACSQAAST